MGTRAVTDGGTPVPLVGLIGINKIPVASGAFKIFNPSITYRSSHGSGFEVSFVTPGTITIVRGRAIAAYTHIIVRQNIQAGNGV